MTVFTLFNRRNLDRKRVLVAGVLLTLAAVFAIGWMKSGPRISGFLPPEDCKMIGTLLKKNNGTGLGTALLKADVDAIANWILNPSEGRLVRLEVQTTNRVLAFLTGGDSANGRLLIIDRHTDGWQISETNNGVRFR